MIEADPDNAEAIRERAIVTLEGVALEAGEETWLGMFAAFAHAEVRARCRDGASSKLDLDGFHGLAKGTHRKLLRYQDGEVDLRHDWAQALFTLLEASYERIAAHQLAARQFGAVIETTAEYRRTLQPLVERSAGLVDMSSPRGMSGGECDVYGHSLYVSHALALAHAGDTSAGLTLARAVAEVHPTDRVGGLARAAVAEIVDLMPLSEPHDAQTLLIAAHGMHSRGQYHQSVQRCHRSLLASKGAGPSVLAAYHQMGWSMLRQGGALEAVLAFQRGLSLAGRTAGKAAARQVAVALRLAVEHLRMQTRNDPFFDPVLRAACLDALAVTGDADDGLFAQLATGQARRGDHLAAADDLQRINTGSPLHREAYFRAVESLWFAGRVPAAKSLLTASAGTASASATARERTAMALLEARLLSESAAGENDPNARRASFRHVLELLGGAELELQDAHPRLLAEVWGLRCQASLELGDLRSADSALDALYEHESTLVDPGYLGERILSGWMDQLAAAGALKPALRAPIGPYINPPEASAVQQLRRQVADFAIKHAARSETINRSSTLLVMQQLEALGDNEACAAFARLALERSANTEHQAEMEADLLPGLGAALLRMHRFEEAYDALIRAEKADPRNYPVKRLICLALGGWREMASQGRMQTVTGLGRPGEAHDKYSNEYRVYGINRDRGVARGDLDWFEFQWECYYFAHCASVKDARYGRRAVQIYEEAKLRGLPSLRERGERGKLLHSLFLGHPPPGS